MKKDRVQEIKDNLLRIGVQDTRRVLEVNAALSRMAELGLVHEQLVALLVTEPEKPKPQSAWSPVDVDNLDAAFPAPGFHGFKDKRQAAVAYYASLPKMERPFEDANRRVETLLKIQEPEKRGVEVGLTLVIPARMEAAEQKALPAIRMRRGADGKIRPIVENEIIDVSAEEVESTVVYLEKKREGSR